MNRVLISFFFFLLQRCTAVHLDCQCSCLLTCCKACLQSSAPTSTQRGILPIKIVGLEMVTVIKDFLTNFTFRHSPELLNFPVTRLRLQGMSFCYIFILLWSPLISITLVLTDTQSQQLMALSCELEALTLMSYTESWSWLQLDYCAYDFTRGCSQL